ncbi:MAG: phosphotransferase [Promethearchaeota archaeon]
MNHYLKLLEQVPPILLPKEITSVHLIKGGLNNRNILINDSWLVKEYLLRDESNDPVYLRFLREKDTLLLFQNDPYTPRLLKYYDDGIKFYITREWVEGHTLTHEEFQTNVESLVNTLVSIHQISEAIDGDFHYYDVIKRYLLEYKEMEQHYPTSPLLERKLAHLPSFERANQFFNDCIYQLQGISSTKPFVRIHGDLVFSNIILTQENSRIILIDWEYSTLADPCIDLAYLITQNQLPQTEQQTIVEKYEEKQDIQINPEVLKLTCDLMDLMSGLWYVIQAVRLGSISNLTSEDETFLAEYVTLAQDRFDALEI